MIYIPSVFEQVKKCFKPRNLVVDGYLFYFHYRVSLILMLVSLLIISLKAHFGEAVDCHWDQNNAAQVKVTNSHCWLYGTYTNTYINKADELACLASYNQNIEACSSRTFDEKKQEQHHHKYYQWLGWVLCFQALLFGVPHKIWKKLEGKRIELIINGCNRTPVFTEEEQNKRFNQVKSVCMTFLGRNRNYTRLYVGCEILNLVVAVMNFLTLNILFHGRFRDYGSKVIWEYLFVDQENVGIPTMDIVFPKVSICKIFKFNMDGSHQGNDAKCLLSMNVINDKVFFGIWMWLVLMIVWSVMNIIYWMVIFSSSRVREWILRWNVSDSVEGDDYKQFIKSVGIYTPVGDWFLYTLISKNVDELTFCRLMKQIAQEKSGLRETPYGIKMEQIENMYKKITHAKTIFPNNSYNKKFESGVYVRGDEYSLDDSGLGEDDGKSGSQKQDLKMGGNELSLIMSSKSKKDNLSDRIECGSGPTTNQSHFQEVAVSSSESFQEELNNTKCGGQQPLPVQNISPPSLAQAPAIQPTRSISSQHQQSSSVDQGFHSSSLLSSPANSRSQTPGFQAPASKTPGFQTPSSDPRDTKCAEPCSQASVLQRQASAGFTPVHIPPGFTPVHIPAGYTPVQTPGYSPVQIPAFPSCDHLEYLAETEEVSRERDLSEYATRSTDCPVGSSDCIATAADNKSPGTVKSFSYGGSNDRLKYFDENPMAINLGYTKGSSEV